MYSLFRDGFVYRVSSEEQFADTHHVAIGDRVAEFAEIDQAVLGTVIGNILQPACETSSGWKLHCANPTNIRFGFDMSPEWVMNRRPTLYIECDAYPADFKLLAETVSGSTKYRVRAGTSYELTAFAACHRCDARLEWTCFDESGHSILSRSLRLPSAKGGRDMRDYDYVTLAVTAPKHAFEAEISVTYGRAQDPLEGFSSFIFLASPSLQPREGITGHDLASILIAPPALSDGASPKVFRAPLDVDYLSTRDYAVKVRGADGSDVETIVSDARSRDGAPRGASIEHFDAITLRFSGFLDGGYTTFIDGVRVGAADLLPKNIHRHEFDLSSRYCDGEYHRVELRDPTGCYRYCETFILVPYQQTPWTVLQEHSGAPPEHLSPAAGHRYKSLVAHIARHAAVDDQSGYLTQIQHAHAVLLKGFTYNRNFAPLRLVKHASPQVTIVIPARDKFDVTYFCLCALIFAYSDVTFEVIVVDDGSSDRTLELGSLVENIVYVRNDVSLGFVHACNKGAECARGEYIVFLNNDTEPAFRWIDELVASFEIFGNVGLAASKLVYPDGRLQEAGGIVWKSGNPWNYGRLANPFDPRYSYTRDVDYASGAAIMLPTALWKEVGGFSDDFAPAYFEDTDLAFKVRAAGHRTLFVATSIVYHFEGITSGTNVSSDAKRNQEINRPRFKSKWRHAFQLHGEEGRQPDLEKDRGIVGRALFLDYSTPRGDMDAGSYAAVQEMQLLQKLGYKVTFFPQNAAHLGDYCTALQRRGIEMLHAPFYSWFGDVLERRGDEFDIVYITRYYVAKEAVALVRRYAPRAKILFCNADLHFLRLLRSASVQNEDAKVVEALRVRDDELEVMRHVDVVLSYTDLEQAVILSHNLLSSRVMKLPWVERVRKIDRTFDQREGVSFLGSFNHHPNVEAVLFFIAQVMPMVLKRLGNVAFHVFGSNMPDDLRKLASRNVVMHGFAEDLDEVFADRKIFVAPLLSGAGIKGKVLAALSRGIPCVVTPIAAEGIGLRHGYDCMIAETPEEWTSALEALLGDAKLWRRIGGNGQALVGEMFSEERGVKMMRGILEAMDLPTV